jgi:glycosyltransferase involved in cell wall biosynthesis
MKMKISSPSILLMPSRTISGRGKCGLKIIQYLSVACQWSVLRWHQLDIVKDGQNGFWASDFREWVDRITKLISDPGLRARMGQEGIEAVGKGYSLSATSEKFFQVLQSLSGGKRDGVME